MNKYYDNDVASNYIDGLNPISENKLIDGNVFSLSSQYNISKNQLISQDALFVENNKRPTTVDVQGFPEREIPSDQIIIEQHNIKFVPVVTVNYDLSTTFSLKNYSNISNYSDISRNMKLEEDFSIDSDIIKLAQSFSRIRNQEWPDDMQPSSETINRAESLWRAIQYSTLRINVGTPNISAADENSIDIFWGDRSSRVLLNIPSSENEMLFLHFINRNGQTIINFTDSHNFNVANLLQRLKDGLD